MRTLVVLTWISTLFPFLLTAAGATRAAADSRTTYKVSRWDEAWRPQRFGRSARGDTGKDGWRPIRFGRGRDEQGWRPQRFGRTEGLREVLAGGDASFPLSLQMTRTDLRDDDDFFPAATGYTPTSLRALADLLRLYDHGSLGQIVHGANQPATNRVIHPPPSIRMIRAAAEGLHHRGFAKDEVDRAGDSFAPPRSTDDWLAEIQRLGLRGRKRRDLS
ncbi:uncharacterized protein LOC144920388 [Branchiostoma floridae x Branchiostoma belcheri]